jgi:hypothetical protein
MPHRRRGNAASRMVDHCVCNDARRGEAFAVIDQLGLILYIRLSTDAGSIHSRKCFAPASSVIDDHGAPRH